MFLYSYNKDSEGAKVLSEALGIRRIRHTKSTFKGSPKKVVINWGSSELPDEVMKSTIINEPARVDICTNKLTFFEHVARTGGVVIPDWTTDPGVAMQWCAEGHTVCARTVLQGHSGEGLILMDKNNLDSFVNARLYTKYVPKLDEYRVHVVNGQVIDIQRKALRNNWIEENPGDKPNYKVRNHANGFVYIRGDVNPPPGISEQALAAVNCVGLTFGAVDIIFNAKRNSCYVLEINTAPGLEGQTVHNYVNAFRNLKG
jgi:glutathione synthase/RimK-type ligase-like ATP-grasp enzyme